MSDEQAAAAPEVAEAPSIEAPEAAEAPQPVDNTAEATDAPRPKSRAEARRQAIKRAKDMAPDVAERARQKALAQPRKEAGKPEGGQFTKDDAGQEPEAESEVAAEAATEPKAEAATTAEEGSTDEPAAKAADLVEIPIPEGHPLRDQGKTSLRVPPDEERDIRTALNAAARSRDLEEAQKQLALYEARMAALQGNAPNPTTDPTIQTLLSDIESAPGYGPELRAKVEAAFQAQQQLTLVESERGAMQKVWERQLVSEFVSQVQTEAPKVFEVWAEDGSLSMRMDQYHREYLGKLDQHNERNPTAKPLQPTKDHFFKWLGQAYRADPRVQAKLTTMREAEKQAERERLRAEVRSEEQKRAEEQRAKAEQRHDTRPPLGSSTTTSAPRPTDEEGLPDAVRSPSRRKALRERVRQRAEQYQR